MAESQVNASTAGTDAAESAEAEQSGLERKMETRHLTMISLGGVIGTGLFLSSGYTITTRRAHWARSSPTLSAPCLYIL